MLKIIKRLLKHKSINIKLSIAVLITISIAVLSLIKIESPPPIKINHIDKYEHAIAYFTLCFIWLLAFHKTKINKFIIVLCCLFYGIIIEVFQTKTSYRSGEILDIVANTTGILIAYITYFLFLRKM